MLVVAFVGNLSQLTRFHDVLSRPTLVSCPWFWCHPIQSHALESRFQCVLLLQCAFSRHLLLQLWIRKILYIINSDFWWFFFFKYTLLNHEISWAYCGAWNMVLYRFGATSMTSNSSWASISSSSLYKSANKFNQIVIHSNLLVWCIFSQQILQKICTYFFYISNQFYLTKYVPFCNFIIPPAQKPWNLWPKNRVNSI